MPVTDDVEKKFVIKHDFKDVNKMKVGDEMCGPIEYHYNIPWKIRIDKIESILNVSLDCPVCTTSTAWSIDITLAGTLFMESGPDTYRLRSTSFDAVQNTYRHFYISTIDKYTVNGNFTIEFSVQIDKVTGNFEKRKLRSFDDESARKHSDVVLVVGDQQFHVMKMYLAAHSTYFDALFSGNFSEFQKSEIELKDIDPEAFQDFLEFLYAESSIEDSSVLGILHLADFFDSKTVVRRCHEFLIQKSQLSLKQKFDVAIKYNLEELKTKCLSETVTRAQLESIIPEEGVHYGEAVWNELFKKALTLIPK